MNAVLQPDKLETIFDYHVSSTELVELFDSEETLDDYLYALDQDSAYADLHYLFLLRDDADNAKMFLSKIQDEKYRRDISMPSCLANN